MSNDVYIRRLGFEDLPRVLVIERQAFTSPWSLAMFVLEMSKPSSVCLAAVDSSDVVWGYLICSRYDTAWHLMNVSVEHGLRRMGVAGKLLNRMFELTRKEGQEQQYTLEVRHSNTVAKQMYERYGFHSAGVRRRYYQNDGEDALIMWLTLRDGERVAVDAVPGLGDH